MHKHIIYMASGNSRRFGENKLLYPLNEKPIFLYGLELLYKYYSKQDNCSLTVVSRYKEVREAAMKLGVSVIDCPDSELGISHTIIAGLLSLQEPALEDFILFAVADQPFITEASIEKLFACAKEGTQTASLAYGNRPGNPTLFSAKLIPELLELEGDKGGRTVIKKHDCIFVQATSEKELWDIDTMQDIN